MFLLSIFPKMDLLLFAMKLCVLHTFYHDHLLRYSVLKVEALEFTFLFTMFCLDHAFSFCYKFPSEFELSVLQRFTERINDTRCRTLAGIRHKPQRCLRRPRSPQGNAAMARKLCIKRAMNDKLTYRHTKGQSQIIAEGLDSQRRIPSRSSEPYKALSGFVSNEFSLESNINPSL